MKEGYLTVNQGSNGQIPGRIGGHTKTKKRPNPVIVERRNEDSCGTASSEDVGPCPLVQSVIYVVYIAVNSKQ